MTHEAPAGFAAMLAMKNLVPLYYEKYDELVRKHTANLNDSQISAAENMAKAPVANFLYSRYRSVSLTDQGGVLSTSYFAAGMMVLRGQVY